MSGSNDWVKCLYNNNVNMLDNQKLRHRKSVVQYGPIHGPNDVSLIFCDEFLRKCFAWISQRLSPIWTRQNILIISWLVTVYFGIWWSIHCYYSTCSLPFLFFKTKYRGSDIRLLHLAIKWHTADLKCNVYHFLARCISLMSDPLYF